MNTQPSAAIACDLTMDPQVRSGTMGRGGPSVPNRRTASACSAFSLIELLVVVSIIAILASMLLSGVAVVKTAARGATCASHMRQLAMCVQAYAQDNDSMLPYVQAVVSENGSPTYKNWPLHMLLEYARERSDTLGWGTGSGEDSNAAQGIYHCAASRLVGGGFSDFGMNGYVFPDNTNGWNMAMGWWNPVIQSISSRTFIFADTWTMVPPQKSDSLIDTRVNYRHGGGANFLFIDSHIERLRPDQVPVVDGSNMWGMRVAQNPDHWVSQGKIPWGNQP